MNYVFIVRSVYIPYNNNNTDIRTHTRANTTAVPLEREHPESSGPELNWSFAVALTAGLGRGVGGGGR